MIRVRVIAPSPALRAGLRSMLSADAGISVADEVGSDSEGAHRDDDVDVIVLASPSQGPGFGFPDTTRPGIPTLFLRNDPIDIRMSTAVPTAWGILPLDASATELQSAVRALAAGLFVAAPSLASATGEVAASGGPLTDRETEVLVLLSKGLANKQIAVSLGISEHTVKFHVSSIYAKLNATNRTQAVREGLRNGWIAL